MTLSRPKILEHLQAGNVIIDPFRPEQLKTASYDVSLGPWYYRQQDAKRTGLTVLNPYDQEHIRLHWGKPQEAVPARTIREQYAKDLHGILPSDRIIMIYPGETLLAHTEEFIGGRRCVVAEMRARSSAGRIGLEVCKCAGWGDIGYFNRWTMELTLNSVEDIPAILVVGRQYSQMVFHETALVDETYAAEGRYQQSDELSELQRLWQPSDMLPRLHRDEVPVENPRPVREAAHG